jgi:DNA-binding transcriptional regulator YiaG
MAAELGVHAVTFSRWERGAIKPRGRHAERWARALADLRDIATEG